MEAEVEQKDFDFSKKVETIIEKKIYMTQGVMKKIKLASFLAIAGLSVGAGLGLTNALMKSILVTHQENSNISVIQAQNEEVRKNKLFEQNLIAKNKQDEIQSKINEKQALEKEKIALAESKLEYGVLMKNKEDILNNYELQLGIYDKAYQNSVQGVKSGLMSLDDLTEIRSLYQAYKKDIHAYITFIHDTTTSFETFNNLTEENKVALREELSKYQSGYLNRSADLESAFVQKIGDSSSDEEDNLKFTTLRTTARNKMIDDLADMVKNDNMTTKTKRLKR